MLMSGIEYAATSSSDCQMADNIGIRPRARLDVVELAAYASVTNMILNLDEVIAIIRNEDHPKEVLRARFGLSESQAEAVLNLRLRQLARLEEGRLQTEQAELGRERTQLEETLGSRRRIRARRARGRGRARIVSSRAPRARSA